MFKQMASLSTIFQSTLKIFGFPLNTIKFPTLLRIVCTMVIMINVKSSLRNDSHSFAKCLENAMYVYCVNAIHLISIFNRKSLMKLFNEIGNYIGNERICNLRTKWRITLFAIIISLISDIVVYDTWAASEGIPFEYQIFGHKITGIAGNVVSTIETLISFSSGGVLLKVWVAIYNISLVSFVHVHQVFFDHFDHFCESRTKSNIIALRLEWRYILRLRSQFDDLFSLIPFITYMELFFKASLYLINTEQTNFEFTFTVVMYWWWFVAQVILTSMNIVSIDYVNHKMVTLFDAFVIQCIRSRNSDLDQLRHEIESDLKMSITGWKMYDINRSFVLNYLSALVTFSVLFMQILSN